MLNTCVRVEHGGLVGITVDLKLYKTIENTHSLTSPFNVNINKHHVHRMLTPIKRYLCVWCVYIYTNSNII